MANASGPIRDGMVLISMPPAGNVRVGQSFQPALKLTLDEETLRTDDDVIEMLNNLVALVEDAIKLFEDHFEDKTE